MVAPLTPPGAVVSCVVLPSVTGLKGVVDVRMKRDSHCTPTYSKGHTHRPTPNS